MQCDLFFFKILNIISTQPQCFMMKCNIYYKMHIYTYSVSLSQTL